MKRSAEERNICKRRAEFDAQWHWPYNGKQERRESNRYRKRRPLDCGNPQCGICHSDKFPKRELTRRENESNLSFKEQMKDFN